MECKVFRLSFGTNHFLSRLLGDFGLGILTRLFGLVLAATGMRLLVASRPHVIVQAITQEILKPY